VQRLAQRSQPLTKPTSAPRKAQRFHRQTFHQPKHYWQQNYGTTCLFPSPPPRTEESNESSPEVEKTKLTKSHNILYHSQIGVSPLVAQF
jgi:hypothetical protein